MLQANHSHTDNLHSHVHPGIYDESPDTPSSTQHSASAVETVSKSSRMTYTLSPDVLQLWHLTQQLRNNAKCTVTKHVMYHAN